MPMLMVPLFAFTIIVLAGWGQNFAERRLVQIDPAFYQKKANKNNWSFGVFKLYCAWNYDRKEVLKVQLTI
jgi:hypothetical protein